MPKPKVSIVSDTQVQDAVIQAVGYPDEVAGAIAFVFDNTLICDNAASVQSCHVCPQRRRAECYAR